jgi:hypothetical protein
MQMNEAYVLFYSTQSVVLLSALKSQIQMFCHIAHYIFLKNYSASITEMIIDLRTLRTANFVFPNFRRVLSWAPGH